MSLVVLTGILHALREHAARRACWAEWHVVPPENRREFVRCWWLRWVYGEFSDTRDLSWLSRYAR